MDYNVIRDYIRMFSIHMPMDSIIGAYYFETLFRLWMKMSAKSTIDKKTVTISISIAEAEVLWNAIRIYPTNDALEQACLLTLIEQIDLNTQRYVTEIREFKIKVL